MTTEQLIKDLCVYYQIPVPICSKAKDSVLFELVNKLRVEQENMDDRIRSIESVLRL